jgi:hypothetical protein
MHRGISSIVLGGRALAVEQYDRRHMTARFRELFAELVKEAATPRRRASEGHAEPVPAEAAIPARSASEGQAEPDESGAYKPLPTSH